MAISTAPVREIRFPNVPKVVNTLYSSAILPNYTERELLLSTRTARRAKIEHKLKKLSKNQLNWSFITETSRSLLPMSSMRNHFERRWNNAFGQALKQNGFDFHGMKLPSSPEQPKEVGLRGTLEIRLFNAAGWDNTDQSKMVQYSDSIVKGLVGLQEKKQNGSVNRKIR